MFNSRIALLTLTTLVGCASAPGAMDRKGDESSSPLLIDATANQPSIFNIQDSPNAYGWNSSNCAHIMADGHCAHPIGANPGDVPAIPPVVE